MHYLIGFKQYYFYHKKTTAHTTTFKIMGNQAVRWEEEKKRSESTTRIGGPRTNKVKGWRKRKMETQRKETGERRQGLKARDREEDYKPAKRGLFRWNS